MINYSEIVKEGQRIAERVNSIMLDLYNDPDKESHNWAVNWGDLSCISVAYAYDVYPFHPRNLPRFIVTISEASPDNNGFCGKIEQIYYEKFHSIIEVISEW
jgi:hypothetical protein